MSEYIKLRGSDGEMRAGWVSVLKRLMGERMGRCASEGPMGRKMSG